MLDLEQVTQGWDQDEQMVALALETLGGQATATQVTEQPACSDIPRQAVIEALDRMRHRGYVARVEPGAGKDRWQIFYVIVPSERRPKRCRYCGGVPFRSQIQELEGELTSEAEAQKRSGELEPGD